MVFLLSDRSSRVGPPVIEISALTSLNYSSNSDFLGLSWVESYQGREGDGSTEENRALGDGFEISVWRPVPSWVPPCFKISGTMCEFTTPLEWKSVDWLGRRKDWHAVLLQRRLWWGNPPRQSSKIHHEQDEMLGHGDGEGRIDTSHIYWLCLNERLIYDYSSSCFWIMLLIIMNCNKFIKGKRELYGCFWWPRGQKSLDFGL